MKEKIQKRQSLKSILRKKKNKKIVLATGCFDILHSGHIELFREAKTFGDILIVGANSDKSIRKLKGAPRPFVKESKRLLNISSLAMVDFVTSFGEDTPEQLISELRPDIFIKGRDWKGKNIPENDILKSYGGRAIFLPIKIKTSTTSLYYGEKNS